MDTKRDFLFEEDFDIASMQVLSIGPKAIDGKPEIQQLDTNTKVSLFRIEKLEIYILSLS